ncbi:MAG: hypothetical protein LBM01_02350 [Christensenellaceae bacterium]|jgi:hypothetical protein|nr:hypothetical protein [Christensenellaceae bacterium]
MKKRFKNVVAATVCFCLAIFSLAGCALFERDMDTYLNMVVASSDDGNIKITKRELINVFNNYGYNQFVTNGGKTVEEGLDETLKLLVDSYSVAVVSARLMGETDKDTGKLIKDYNTSESASRSLYRVDGKLAATEQETLQARKAVFDSINSALKTYIDEEREKRYGKNEAEEETTETDTETVWQYSPYTKSVNYEGGKYSIDVSSLDNQVLYTEDENKKNDPNYTYVPKYFALTVNESDPIEKDIARVALTRLVRTLLNNEDGQTVTKTTEQENVKFVDYSADKSTLLGALIKKTEDGKQNYESLNALNRQIARDLENQERSIVGSRLQNLYATGLYGENIIKEAFERYSSRSENFDTFKAFVAGETSNNPVAAKTATDAINQYKSKVIAAYNDYRTGVKTAESIGSGLLDSLSGVYFVPESVADKFFTVSHILIKYSDEQTAAIEAAKARYKEDPTFNLSAELENIKGQVKTQARNPETGKFEGEYYTVDQVYAMVKNALNGITIPSMTTDATKRYNTFLDLIYKFCNDDGMNNASYEYVVGTEESGMIKEFTDDARELYATGKRGAISGAPVWGEYGAHIIMYTRNISDFIFVGNDLSALDSGFETTLYATTTSYGEKTNFDIAVEGTTRADYGVYEEDIINNYQLATEITTFKRNYKDLYKA